MYGTDVWLALRRSTRSSDAPAAPPGPRTPTSAMPATATPIVSARPRCRIAHTMANRDQQPINDASTAALATLRRSMHTPSTGRRQGAGVDFRVLGPIDVLGDAGAVPLGGEKPRALLAALMLRRGRAVTTDALVHAAWERPPPTVDHAVAVYFSRLRAAIAGANGDRQPIVTSRNGYAPRSTPTSSTSSGSAVWPPGSSGGRRSGRTSPGRRWKRLSTCGGKPRRSPA